MDGSRNREGSLGPRTATGYPAAPRLGDLCGMDLTAWPAGQASDKALMRRKLLQPLPRAPHSPSAADIGQLPMPWSDSCKELAGALPVRPPREAEPSVRPPLAPSPHRSAPSESRPGTSQRPRTGERPRTAERRPPVADVGFPAQLSLRGPKEAANCPFARSEALVVPLDTQQAIRNIARACARGRRAITDGTCLTAWVVNAQEGAGPAEQLLEPLAARRLDRSLAVEPIELVAERQAPGGGTALGQGGEDLRYGEGFRLRAAGCAGLYLGHSGDGREGLRWVSAPPARPDEDEEPPRVRGTRFAAHGGELGAPVVFGGRLSLLRVSSPPLSDDESEYEDSASESGSDSDTERLSRAKRAAANAKANAAPTAQELAQPAASSLMPEAGKYVAEGLFCRAADAKSGVFEATLLPLFAEPVALT
mmetsp:Transcript_103328/g.267229  ORF Transcript_103328/g.267229 Transcript_103328/m.267229 type:complete len:422 (-) Transcript_103328:203-1468(-)